MKMAFARVAGIMAGVLVGVTVWDVSAFADHAPTPVVTDPSSSTIICLSPGASTAPLSFAGTINAPVDQMSAIDNSNLIDSWGPQDAGAWSWEGAFVRGDHAVFFQSNVSGEEGGHLSEPSAETMVSVLGVQDVLGTLTRSLSRFSPKNQDGYKDSATFSVPVLRSGTLRFQVLRSGAVIRQSGALSAPAGTSKTWTWDGRDGTGQFVGSGSYSIRALWLGSPCGQAMFVEQAVTVDGTAPNGSVSAVPARFYPHEADAFIEFKDTVAIRISGLTEPAVVTLQLFRRGAAKPFRVVPLGSRTSNVAWSWSGRDRAGSILPAGMYQFRFKLVDALRNARLTPRHDIELSHKRLLARTATVSKWADAYYSGTQGGCGVAYHSLSDWTRGVWLDVPDCYYNDEAIDGVFLRYRFTVPAAAYHHALTFKAHGYSTYGDELFGFAYDNNARDWQVVGSVAGLSPATRTFGTRFGEKWFDGRTVRGALFLVSLCDCVDVEYDVRHVEAVVRYGVLG